MISMPSLWHLIDSKRDSKKQNKNRTKNTDMYDNFSKARPMQEWIYGRGRNGKTFLLFLFLLVFLSGHLLTGET